MMCSFKPFFVCHSSTVCFLMTQNDRSICRRRTNMRLAVTVRAQPVRTQQSRSQACGFPVSSTVPSILQSKKAKGLKIILFILVKFYIGWTVLFTTFMLANMHFITTVFILGYQSLNIP